MSRNTKQALGKESFRVIEEKGGEKHEVTRPSDIDLSLVDTFGKNEVEVAAANLLRFFRHKGRWCAFTISELLSFYKRRRLPHPRRMFYGLSGPWEDDGALAQMSGNPFRDPHPFLVLGYDGRYRITDLFIRQCATKLTAGRR